jgi:hypothetical protein
MCSRPTPVWPGSASFDGEFDGEGRVGDGRFVTLQVTGRAGIPDGAVATSVNYGGGDVRSNAVLTDLVVDVNGVFI